MDKRKVSYSFGDIANDKVFAMAGTTLPTPLLPKEIVDGNPLGEWWIEKATNGTPVLCTNLPLFAELELEVSAANLNTTYTASSHDFIKAHPIHRPGK